MGERDRFLPWVLFQATADGVPAVREWRAIQRQRNCVELQVQLVPGEHDHESRIATELIAKLVERGFPSGVAVTVTVVDDVAPDASTGKIRRMISEVGPSSTSR